MERELETFFGADGAHFDVLHLGMGGDGHVASLFPGTDALAETERRAIATTAPPSMDVADRVSLTLTVFNAAALVLFAATGASKRDALADVFGGKSGLPAARVAPIGDLVWMLDDALGRGIADGV